MTQKLSDEFIFNILLVEDNESDARLAHEALVENSINHILTHVEDGMQALDFLYHRGLYKTAPRPDLILLDLNLPKINGHEVLLEIKSDENLKQIPVVVLSISHSKLDIEKSYKLNANYHITKPPDIKEFIEIFGMIKDYWLKPTKMQL